MKFAIYVYVLFMQYPYYYWVILDHLWVLCPDGYIGQILTFHLEIKKSVLKLN